jgi:mono/diheme cytochrome c family protein
MALGLSACRADRDLPPAYRKVAVPKERLAATEARERGRRLFLQHCALCHGERADGRGVRREGLSTPPRDFTSAEWRERFSPRRTFWVLREGKPSTAMPSFRALPDGDLWDLTAYVLSVSEVKR